jgi:hypothetical protein
MEAQTEVVRSGTGRDARAAAIVHFAAGRRPHAKFYAITFLTRRGYAAEELRPKSAVQLMQLLHRTDA